MARFILLVHVQHPIVVVSIILGSVALWFYIFRFPSVDTI